MEPRRPPRTVSDPKVRQVGFVTPAAAPPARTVSDTAAMPAAGASQELPLSGSSLSPVMIPPPRHDGLSARVTALLPVPIAATALRLDNLQIRVGSYNQSEVLLGTPPMTSPSSRIEDAVSEFSDDVSASSLYGRTEPDKVGTAFPGRSGDLMPAKSVVAGGSIGSHTPENPPTASLVVKALPGITEKKRGMLEKQHDEAAAPKPLKEKTTKAERRALQEAQRAAKSAAKEGGGADPTNTKKDKVVKPTPQKKDVPEVAASSGKKVDRPLEKERKKEVLPLRMQFDDKHKVEKVKQRAIVNQREAKSRVEFFQRLPQYVHGTQLQELEAKFFQLDAVHPSVYKVGLHHLSGKITGGNARCIAMLLAFKEAIKDYSTPPEKALVRDLNAKISGFVSFLIECRPLSISMGNAIKFLKNRIAKLPLSMSELDAKASIQSDIDRFINQKIIIADKVIVRHAFAKIRDGDVLLTYGLSSVVEMILVYAHEHKKKFRIVIVDSRPKHEGQILLRRLVAKGLNCTYTHINAISYIMHEVTRVFLGAASVLSNGTVYSRVGTACVAMVAKAYRVPVLICCEAYKFHERVQLDSICFNELGDPDAILKVPTHVESYLYGCMDNDNLQLLNLNYDATPSDYVSMIITDYGMLPPTSVPVIMREYDPQNLWI
ncbi:translation initiation factor eIF-2B subunit delta-like [Zingiber officinale]|uniref:translation initiation factor eIF-2B subunit delta-like n=1 Tax=Zingiber officinale TaxID=94328 RepID=UPI001C4C8D62|nr:translation initiation factor eIF-2B subunit delta-like [Zingiber officinale]XP_042438240.1 translation initiation factor eIF-2B subunit delta-like [Zingiber officinale]